MRKILGITILLILLPALAFGATYYVDTTRPDDTGDGLTEETAWKTLTKLNATTFVAGDIVKLHRAQTWTGMWTLLGSGAAGNIITISSYSTGALPIIDANSANAYALYFNGNDYVTVDGIDARNGTTANIGFAGTTDAVTVQNCSVSGGAKGISINLSAGPVVSGNTVSEGTGTGIELVNASNANGTISNNTLTGTAGKNPAYAMYIDGSGHTVSGNTVSGWIGTTATNKIIHFQSTDLVTVSGNLVTGSAVGYDYNFSACTSTTLSGTNTSTNAGGMSFYFNAGSGFTVNILVVNNATGVAGLGAITFLNNTGVNTVASATVSTTSNRAIFISGAAVTITNPTITNVTSDRGIYINGASNVALINPQITTITNSSCLEIRDSATVTITGGELSYCIVDGLNVNETSATNSYRTYSHHNGGAGASSGDGFTAHNTATLNLHNCIGAKNTKSGAAMVQGSHGVIENCTFFDNYDDTVPGDNYGIVLDTTAGASWTIKNNITKNHLYEVYISAAAVAAGLTLDSDYNLFDDSRGGSAFHYNGTNYNFAGWKTASSQDANSINDDPLFQNAESGAFRLGSESPAIDSGTSLGLTQDFENNAIPYSSAPDIGAYENHDTFVYGKGRLKTGTNITTVTTP